MDKADDIFDLTRWLMLSGRVLDCTLIVDYRLLSIAVKSTTGFFIICVGHRSGRVLGNSVAEGPVFLLHLDKDDENVLTSKADALVQSVGDCFVEGFLDPACSWKFRENTLYLVDIKRVWPNI